MPDQDELYLEFMFLHSIQKFGLNVTNRQFAEDWASYLNPNQVWAGNSEALGNFRKGIWPPNSGKPEYNKYYNAIDFQIECELFGLISPGMLNTTKKWSYKAGEMIAYDEGLDAGVAISAMISEAFFESDPVKLMEFGISALPNDSKYAKMMRTLLTKKEQCETWEELWKVIQNEPWRGGVLIEGAYSFIGLLYGEGDLLKSMNISMRCGEDSDCNPATTAGLVGAIYGYSKLPAEFKKLRKLPIDNYAIKEIYPKMISWDRILNETNEIGKWNLLENGGYIENGMMYIPKN